jgi:hypothetical protein
MLPTRLPSGRVPARPHTVEAGSPLGRCQRQIGRPDPGGARFDVLNFSARSGHVHVDEDVHSVALEAYKY